MKNGFGGENPKGDLKAIMESLLEKCHMVLWLGPVDSRQHRPSCGRGNKKPAIIDEARPLHRSSR